MGRIQCTRLAGSASAEATINFDTGACFHGLIINVIAFGTAVHAHGGTSPFEVRVYADNTGASTTNLIYRDQNRCPRGGTGLRPPWTSLRVV